MHMSLIASVSFPSINLTDLHQLACALIRQIVQRAEVNYRELDARIVRSTLVETDKKVRRLGVADVISTTTIAYDIARVASIT